MHLNVRSMGPYGYKNNPFCEIIVDEILRMNTEFEIVWKFSAMDIFVKMNGDGPAFEMLEDKICLYDFLGNYYEIDYDGKLQFEKRI